MPAFPPVILRGFPHPVKRVEDVVYSSPNGRDLHADLYLPAGEQSPLPVILWIHGSSATEGRRSGPDLTRCFAERGFAMVAVDYRPELTNAVEDIAASIQWIKEVSEEWNLDPHRMGLWGASLGGQVALQVALSGSVPQVKAVAAFYPSGGATAAPEGVASGRPGAPAILLAEGIAGRQVLGDKTQAIYQALRDQDLAVTLSVISGLKHGFLENGFDQTLPHKSHISRPGEPEFIAEAPPFTFGTLETFFKRHL